MEGKNPYLMLDKVLEWFAMDIDDIDKNPLVTRINVIRETAYSNMCKTMKELNVPEFIVYNDVIIEKLVKDGYLSQDRALLSITFEGKLFSKQGGYREKNRKESISYRNAYIQTLVLTGGTAAAGAYGIFEICKWIFHHEHWKLLF